MNHQRYTDREKVRSITERNFTREFLRKVSMHARKVYSAFLDDISTFDHPRAPSATPFPFPKVFVKRAAIDFGQRSGDAVLQRHEVLCGVVS